MKKMTRRNLNPFPMEKQVSSKRHGWEEVRHIGDSILYRREKRNSDAGFMGKSFIVDGKKTNNDPMRGYDYIFLDKNSPHRMGSLVVENIIEKGVRGTK